MEGPLRERRAHERAEAEWARTARATLRPGHPILIVNISRGGALVDGSRQMRPGTRVLLQIVTPQASVGLSAYVLRCGVRSLCPHEGITYRGALRFDERRDWTTELGTFDARRYV
jgi:hypothetical protein